ncbi:MAG TPA: hypothetical protein ACFYD1_00535 [Candidatus Hypogeohydataceae bacterium YC38]|nr:hypothetical protein [Candidatus Brocadiales bacterium]
MATEALVRLVIRADGVPEIQRTAEGFKKATQSIKETEKAFNDLNRASGGGTGVAGGALWRAIRAHPLLTVAGGLFAASRAIRSFGEEELTLARTEAILRGRGIEDMREAGRVATEMAHKTLPTYREQYEALGSLVLITGDYKKAQNDLVLVNNIAANIGWDLNTAAFAYGRLLEGDTLLLGKYVHKLKELTEEQKKNKELTRSIVAGAMSGAAEAQARTPTGQMIQARKEIAKAVQVGGGLLTKAIAPVARAFTGFVVRGPEFLNDLGGLLESNRVESEAFRRRFFPEQLEAERRQKGESEYLKALVARTNFNALVVRAGNEVAAQATIMGRIRELQGAINAEYSKGGASLEVIKKALAEINALQEKEIKLRQEIRGIGGEFALGQIGRVGRLVDVVKGLGGEPEKRIMTPSGPRWTEATGAFALRERFGGTRLAPGLTLGGALQEREGITGFDVFRQKSLWKLLQDKEMPTAFRAKVGEEFFSLNLSMLGKATTPEAQARLFPQAMLGLQVAERAALDKATEDVKDRKEMIGLLRDGNEKLDTIVGLLGKNPSVSSASDASFWGNYAG